ncbi:MAG: VWA domain-containing protein [Alphaproteobacteria bacterium]|nr:VWA domain-containing protein [Alphaproteobacteria bacterium]
MRRRNRSLVVFNLSAMDLLAMATGVFVLLVVMLMPYYQRSFDANADIADVRADIERAESETEALRKGAAADGRSADQLLAAAAALRAQAASQQDAVAALRAQAKAAEARAARATKRADDQEVTSNRKIVGQFDLVFVVDTTASMKPVLRDLSLSIGGIVRILERLVDSLRVGVVAYRDYDFRPGWVVRDLSPTPTATRAGVIYDFISGLKPPIRGGYTPREAVYSGLQQALSMALRSGAKQAIIVIGDAAPHREEEAATLNLARNFARSGPRRTLSVLFVSTPSYRHFGDGDDRFFAELARAGGGKFSTHGGQMIESVLLSVLEG